MKTMKEKLTMYKRVLSAIDFVDDGTFRRFCGGVIGRSMVRTKKIKYMKDSVKKFSKKNFTICR